LALIPDSKCTLSDKRLYGFIAHAVGQYNSRTQRATTNRSQLTTNLLGSSANSQPWVAMKSVVGRKNVVPGTFLNDYTGRGPMYREIPLYNTGFTTVKRVPRVHVKARTKTRSSASKATTKKLSESLYDLGVQETADTLTSYHTIDERHNSPTGKFIRMR
jgi:hypothetical protein